MNDNYWYPREPMPFLTDTIWCDAATEVAHNRLTDTYYALGRPIRDSDDEICNIGKIKPADYQRVRGNLERLGWKFESGVLRHGRIEQTMLDMNARAQAQHERTAAATAARAQAQHERTAAATAARAQAQRNVTDNVTKHVTDNVTSNVDSNVTEVQLQSQLQSQSKTQLQPNLNRGLEEKSRLANPTFRARDLANRIYGNKDGWSYDNCKVQAEKIEPRSLASVIERALVSKTTLTDHDVLNAWLDASQTAHGAAVDGLPKARKCPEAYAIACFKSNLNL